MHGGPLQLQFFLKKRVIYELGSHLKKTGLRIIALRTIAPWMIAPQIIVPQAIAPEDNCPRGELLFG